MIRQDMDEGMLRVMLRESGDRCLPIVILYVGKEKKRPRVMESMIGACKELHKVWPESVIRVRCVVSSRERKSTLYEVMVSGIVVGMIEVIERQEIAWDEFKMSDMIKWGNQLRGDL